MKKLFLILGVMAVALSASIVFAGLKNNTPVTIRVDTTTTTVYGSLEATRNTSDTIAYLHCQSSLVGTRAVCAGRTPDGSYALAWTTDPNMINQMLSISSSTYLYFRFNNSTSEITTLSITNGSQMLP